MEEKKIYYLDAIEELKKKEDKTAGEKAAINFFDKLYEKAEETETTEAK